MMVVVAVVKGPLRGSGCRARVQGQKRQVRETPWRLRVGEVMEGESGLG